MRQVIVLVLLVLLMVFGVAPVASADVHPVSQAQCAPDGVASGAISSRHAIEAGRPAAPIPVTASGGQTQGRAGAAPANGVHC